MNPCASSFTPAASPEGNDYNKVPAGGPVSLPGIDGDKWQSPPATWHLVDGDVKYTDRMLVSGQTGHEVHQYRLLQCRLTVRSTIILRLVIRKTAP